MTGIRITRRDALAGAAGAGVIMGFGGLARAAAPADPAASKLFDDIAWRLLDLSPESATDRGVDVGAHADLRSRLDDRSLAGNQARAETLRRDLAAVEQLEMHALPPAERTTAAVIASAYRTALAGFALPYGDVAIGGWRNTPYVVIQNVGAYLDIPRFLEATQPVHTGADAEAYLARLAQFPAVLDGELARLKAAGAQKVVAPDFLLDKAIAQMEQTLADARAGGGLVTSLTKRTADIPGDWGKRARKIVTGPVAGALDRQLAELKVQRAQATGDAGMWARPHGEEWYDWGLRASTTTTLKADEIHAMGLQQLAQLHGRMDPILRKLGYASGTVGQRMAALGKDKRFQFPESDTGRAEVIALMKQKLAYIRTRLPLAFRTLVMGNLEIRRLPLAEEAGAPSAYGGAGSIDGKIPGKVWVNLGNVGQHTRFTVPDLVFHEGIPGHVWQGEYANRLPLIRAILAFNAYSEGWALYAEQLADELGAYDDDPVGRLGYLQAIAFRACRLVVDTGIHAKRWTREQGVQFFVERNGSLPLEVGPEVDRYCSWPGQACGYKIGHSEILRQRERARTALGAAYDLRDFDDAVVMGGNVPLDVLGQNVGYYIAARRTV